VAVLATWIALLMRGTCRNGLDGMTDLGEQDLRD